MLLVSPVDGVRKSGLEASLYISFLVERDLDNHRNISFLVFFFCQFHRGLLDFSLNPVNDSV